ncbi:hypothetical protein [Szabonella alba]|uniref:Uncharacterized protein n=1 Tax=Szabonella alba TaxID=2804194 RepID=A0A8K0VE48_9RHOB|nr:hypothetical protein [Szabonella alba]MBL4917440.1 hypothetical protein [Szabonella alba]
MPKDYFNPASAATSIADIGGLHRKVIVQGLIYGIAQIQSLPDERREELSHSAMCDLVRKITDDHDLAYTLWGVEHHVGFDVDLWPENSGPGPYGSYSDEEMDRKEDVRFCIYKAKRKFAQTCALADAPPSDVIRFFGFDGSEGEAE